MMSYDLFADEPRLTWIRCENLNARCSPLFILRACLGTPRLPSLFLQLQQNIEWR